MTETFASGCLVLDSGAVATLTIDRPDKRNAMTLAMWSALPAICDRMEGDPVIRAVILAGAGSRAFCAGADIAEFDRVYATPESGAAYNACVRAAQARLRDLRCPTVAAVRGACFGGGCGLALACDLRVADGTSRFAITPARLGIAYSPADTWQLMEKVGAPRAKDLLLTGRTVDGAEALAIGLADRLVDDAAEGAAALARELAAHAPGALAAIKRIANGLSRAPEAPELQAMFGATFAGVEFREGRDAFRERRPPVFGDGWDR